MPLLPTVIVVLAAFGASRLARRLLKPGPQALDRGAFRQQLLQFFIGLAAVVLVLIVLPVDAELRGQLLSLFGIMFSAAVAFSSTTLLGNVMAGFMLKAVRNFRTGDFVRVGDVFGRVTGRGLLSTEVQTEDRDLITLPNLHLVSHPVRVVRTSGTIIAADVSLGYDVDHQRVEELLREAGRDAGLTETFVLVTHLGDYSVTYRAAGLLTEVKHLLTARSQLRRAMLDRLHGGGVEIVSPAFMNQRQLDSGKAFIPRPDVLVGPDDAATPETALEDLAFDKADEAVSLEQLIGLQARLRAVIAGLADPQRGLDPDEAHRRRDQLTRRLARLEAAIAARSEESDGDRPTG